MAAIPPTHQISQQHNNIYETYFRQVNPSGNGTIGAGEIASFLKKSGLPEGTLHNIWNLADQGSKGFLNKQGFFVALKLIALAQNGKEISLKCLSLQLAQPPNMGGSPRPVSTTTEYRTQPPSGKVSSMDTSWAIKAKDKQQYDNIFDSLQPIKGLLPGDKVRPVLLNSKLPVDVLGKIWDLADIDQDGSLDRDEFSVAMYLVYRRLDGEAVPSSLPQLLVPPSKRTAASISISTAMPISLSSVPVSGATPVSLPVSSSVAFSKETAWVVSTTDRQKYEKMFQRRDLDNDGLVSGVEIKDILIASGLQQNILAHIWNLCDIDNTGQLNSEQFALAMYLIAQQKAGKEPPEFLTPEMIPPTSRNSNLGDLSSIHLESKNNDFSAIKELDQITTDIEQLGREKASLQQEISQTEEAIRKRKSEIEDLKNELEKANKGLEMLSKQKNDAQTGLNELDSEKTKFKTMLKDVQSKCNDEEQMLKQLKSKLTSQQSNVEQQEQELQSGREELESLRKEEEATQLKVNKNKAKLEALKNSIATNKAEINQAQNKIDKLNEENNSIKDEISQLTSMANATSSSTSLNEFNYGFEARFKDMDQISARATAGSSPVSSISGFSVGSSGKIDEDDFKETDPFKGKTDPFSNNENDSADPFSSDDPFKSDPFKTVSFADDPFASDPFQSNDPFSSDIFKSTNKNEAEGGKEPFQSIDLFGSDSFTAADNVKTNGFGTTKAMSVESNSSDPFSSNEAFSTAEYSTGLKMKTKKNITFDTDSFTNDPFASNDLFSSSKPTTADPFASADANPETDVESFAASSTTKKKTDPFLSMDSGPFATAASSSNDPFASSSSSNDPFASSSSSNDPFTQTHATTSSDPFSSASSSTLTSSNDPWLAFSTMDSATAGSTTKPGIFKQEMSKPKIPSSKEEKAFEWAKRESEREERERQRRIKELADQEEMEMALALKQSVESSSEA